MKKRTFLFLFLAIVLILSSCSRKSIINSGQADYNNEVQKSEEKSTADQSADTRKIVITADYSIETTDFSAAVSKIKEITEKSGGYIEQSNVAGEKDGSGSADFTLRIPDEKAGDLDKFFEGVGYITSGTQNRKDITDTYYDTKGSLDAKNIQYDRITELLKKANNLDDILKLEDELNRIRTDIETLTSQMKNYDNQVNFATVEVSLYSVAKLSDNQSFFEKTGETFKESFAFAGEIAIGLWYIFIWLFPFILFFGVAGVIIVIILIIKKKKKKQ